MKKELTPNQALELAANKLKLLKYHRNYRLTDDELSYNVAIEDCIDELIKLGIMLERKANLQEQINKHEGGFQGGIETDGLSGFRG